jgi:hypothetical protein
MQGPVIRDAAVLASCMSTALFISGCAVVEGVERESRAVVGMSVQQLEELLPPDTAYVAYDVSYPVLGKGPRYGTADGGGNRDWLVVVVCGELRSLAVGVVHADDYSAEVASSSRRGDFDDLLTECR